MGEGDEGVGEKERRREKNSRRGVDVIWTWWVSMSRRVARVGRWAGKDWSGKIQTTTTLARVGREGEGRTKLGVGDKKSCIGVWPVKDIKQRLNLRWGCGGVDENRVSRCIAKLRVSNESIGKYGTYDKSSSNSNSKLRTSCVQSSAVIRLFPTRVAVQYSGSISIGSGSGFVGGFVGVSAIRGG